MASTYNLSTRKAEERGSEVQGQPQLHSEFKARPVWATRDPVSTTTMNARVDAALVFKSSLFWGNLISPCLAHDEHCMNLRDLLCICISGRPNHWWKQSLVWLRSYSADHWTSYSPDTFHAVSTAGFWFRPLPLQHSLQISIQERLFWVSYPWSHPTFLSIARNHLESKGLIWLTCYPLSLREDKTEA